VSKSDEKRRCGRKEKKKLHTNTHFCSQMGTTQRHMALASQTHNTPFVNKVTDTHTHIQIVNIFWMMGAKRKKKKLHTNTHFCSQMGTTQRHRALASQTHNTPFVNKVTDTHTHIQIVNIFWMMGAKRKKKKLHTNTHFCSQILVSFGKWGRREKITFFFVRHEKGKEARSGHIILSLGDRIRTVDLHCRYIRTCQLLQFKIPAKIPAKIPFAQSLHSNPMEYRPFAHICEEPRASKISQHRLTSLQLYIATPQTKKAWEDQRAECPAFKEITVNWKTLKKEIKAKLVQVNSPGHCCRDRLTGGRAVIPM